MFEYELQQIRTAEMIREADNYRLVREAVRGRRAARREAARSGRDDSEGRVHSRRHRTPRSARVA
ncbi:hypothetical protein QFZ24_003400 [Streptomyces phaeochromogenes]|jgi:hypothetical protein|uniref:hypothetical protein n=1 Tax=Streptomyces TaxID=1883 RepID=UPI00117ECFDD|nr:MULTISPECIES: hypothetical protein [Streptomyces]MDQ0949477.1 hypothetical protein [Streptomyces phaeochromogenes]TRO61177.1 hypothetical protein E4K73_26650 [Streptomyces sp. IB201691-2A2]